VVTNNETGVSISGTFTGNGAGVANVNAATLNGVGATNFWQLDGNNVTAAVSSAAQTTAGGNPG